MSLLNTGTTGIIQRPFYGVFFGGEGTGKTTCASKFPEVCVSDIEDGTALVHFRKRIEPKNFQDILFLIEELINTKHPYQTYVIDSLDHLETLIWAQVLEEYNKANADKKVKSFPEIPYGAGYKIALGKWKQLGEKLKELRKKLNVILIAHSEVKTINDPSLAVTYGKHVIKIHPFAADYIKESVEAIFFFNFEIFAAKKDNEKIGRAFGEGNRVIYTMATPSSEGKNRYSLPPLLPFNKDTCYDDLMKAITEAKPADPLALAERIQFYLPQLKNEKARESAMQQFQAAKEANDIPKLKTIENKLQTIIETQ